MGFFRFLSLPKDSVLFRAKRENRNRSRLLADVWVCLERKMRKRKQKKRIEENKNHMTRSSNNNAPANCQTPQPNERDGLAKRTQYAANRPGGCVRTVVLKSNTSSQKKGVVRARAISEHNQNTTHPSLSFHPFAQNPSMS